MALRMASSTMDPTPIPSPRAVPAPPQLPQAVALLRLFLCLLLRPPLRPVTTPQLRATIWPRATHKVMETVVEAPLPLPLPPLQLLSPHPLVLMGPMVPHRECPPNASSTTNFAPRFLPGARRMTGMVRWTPRTTHLLRHQGGFSSLAVYIFRSC